MPSTGSSTATPRWAARSVSGRLPDFPWDRLVPWAEHARAHPDGVVDLSIGTPVDPTPQVVQDALAGAADSPGYPLTVGRVDLRQACVDWLERRFEVTGLGVDAVLPAIGSKELIAGLPSHLGLGPGDVVVTPALAYPTYEVGAVLAGATRGAHRLPDLGRPGAGRHGLGELPLEPDRPGAARRAPAQGPRLVP